MRRMLERTSPLTAFVLALAAVIVLCTGEIVTGIGLAFTLFYVLPIALVAWCASARLATIIAVLAVAGSAFAVLENVRHVHFGRLVWNHVGELGVYVFIAIVVSALRAQMKLAHADRNAAVDQLRHAERLNTIGKLAAGIAHELGTPLGTIAGYAELIGAGAPASEGAKIILDESHKMTGIIRKLLDFARQSQGAKRTMDLVGLVRDAIDLVRPLARKKNLTLSLSSSSSAHPVRSEVNPAEIEQVVNNLVVNAIHATTDGGRVDVRIEQDAFSARIVVEDTGSGIAPEHIAHVFDPFFTTKDVGEGTGLGLSVSYGIVLDHGGSIHVESTLGRGSAFVVTLPRA